MALSTYAELVASVADTLNRDDLTATVPDFIRMATAETTSKLRVRQMICRSTATINTEYSAMPLNFCGVKALSILANPIVDLEFRDADDLRHMKQTHGTLSGTPQYYSIVGSEFQWYPAPASDMTVELIVYETIPDLATYDTNWLLDRYPSVCLYGALKHSAPYLKDDSRVSMWSALYEDGLEAIRKADLFEHNGHKPVQRSRRFG